MIKSPLTQAFGLALHKRRILYSIEPSSITKELSDMQASYYRACEAGTYSIHISHSYNLYRAFEGQLSIAGLTHLLGVISILDSATKSENKDDRKVQYSKLFYEKFKEISQEHVDYKLRLLREKFEECNIFESLATKSSEEMKDEIEKSGLHLIIDDFISLNYENFGKSNISIYDKFPVNFFSDVPTVYKEFLESTKKNLKLLPTKYDYNMSWDWENRNQHLFKRLCCVGSKTDFIINKDNLRRYKYRYLWESNFEEACILFLNERQDKHTLKKEFKRLLKESLEIDNEKELLKTLDAVFEKIKIETLNENQFDIRKMLSTSDNYSYNSFWIFEYVDGFNVGIKAIIPETDWLIKEGLYLTYDDTKKLLVNFEKLWNKSDDEDNE